MGSTGLGGIYAPSHLFYQKAQEAGSGGVVASWPRGLVVLVALRGRRLRQGRGAAAGGGGRGEGDDGPGLRGAVAGQHAPRGGRPFWEGTKARPKCGGVGRFAAPQIGGKKGYGDGRWRSSLFPPVFLLFPSFSPFGLLECGLLGRSAKNFGAPLKLGNK